jgi:hypothetical protein
VLSNVVLIVFADCAGKGKIQNEPLQLRDEENSANEGKGHGPIKVRLLAQHYTEQVGSVGNASDLYLRGSDLNLGWHSNCLNCCFHGFSQSTLKEWMGQVELKL